MTKYMLMEGQPLTGEYTIPQTGHWMIETRNVDGSRVDLFKKMSPELAEIIPGKIDIPYSQNAQMNEQHTTAVSYTHLTLPTIYSV